MRSIAPTRASRGFSVDLRSVADSLVFSPNESRKFGLVLLAVLALMARAAPTNVLLIMSDDLTACLSCYGNATCRTPNLDRLAREGVLFERAYCQYPVCGPSRASFMSGLYPNTVRLTGNQKQRGSFKVSNRALANHPSIGEFLRNNGYFSARASARFTTWAFPAASRSAGRAATSRCHGIIGVFT